jgi:hypothetical protein
MADRSKIIVFLLVLSLPFTSFSAESKVEGGNPSDISQSNAEETDPLDYIKEEGRIPLKPTAPPSLRQRSSTDVPHCERYYLLKGKRFECDSEIGKDALRFNSLMADLPYAMSELETYRENRKKIRMAGFVGSIGIFTMLSGFLMSHPPLDQYSGAIRPGGFVILAGLAIVANSFIYGLSMLRANDLHIANAVQNYNSVHPNQPIELEFSTQFDF